MNRFHRFVSTISSECRNRLATTTTPRLRTSSFQSARQFSRAFSLGSIGRGRSLCINLNYQIFSWPKPKSLDSNTSHFYHSLNHNLVNFHRRVTSRRSGPESIVIFLTNHIQNYQNFLNMSLSPGMMVWTTSFDISPKVNEQ